MIRRFLISLAVALAAAVLYRISAVDYLPFGVRTIPVWQAIGCAALVVFAVTWIVARWLSSRWAVAFGVIAAFAPLLWYGASDGAAYLRHVGVAAVGAVVLNRVAFWFADKVFDLSYIQHEMRKARAKGKDVGRDRRRRLIADILFYVFIVFGVAFVANSACGFFMRDGEGASIYARDIVEENAMKWIVSDGIAERQIAWVAGRVARPCATAGTRDACPYPFVISVMETAESRSNLVKRVEERWPGNDALIAAAKIGRTAFVNAALREVPDEIHVIGPGATNEALAVAFASWSRRWEHLKPIMERGRDPFCRLGRRAFAREGNHIGGRLQAAGDNEQASKVYRRVAFEIEPDNISACVNIGEMARRKVWKGPEGDCRHAAEIVRKFMKDKRKMDHREELVRLAGPVYRPPELMQQLGEAAKRMVEAKLKAGEKLPVPEAWKRIGEKNDRMIGFMEKGDLKSAGVLAREMLSSPRTANAVPANAVMATVLLSEGDSAGSETFFRRAIEGSTNEVPAIVCNNFAVALQRNGKLEEAERYARDAVRKFSAWQFLDTLASILIDRGRLDEAREVLDQASDKAYSTGSNGSPVDGLKETRKKLSAAKRAKESLDH